MWEFMESTHPTVFVKNYEEGITRVKGGGYAFLMESTVLQYKVQVSTYSMVSIIRPVCGDIDTFYVELNKSKDLKIKASRRLSKV